MESSVSFLTARDARAAIKGSVDPLGSEVLWGAAGRRVVHNLTTVSTSLADFAICLTGIHLAHEVRQGARANQTDMNASAIFLRWEQLCAYARYTHIPNSAFRGIEFVKGACSSGGNPTISAAGSHQILSNQRTYGIWGLYRSPLLACQCLLPTGVDEKLSPMAEHIVRTVHMPRVIRDGVTEKMLHKFLVQDDNKFSPKSPLSANIASFVGLKGLPRAAKDFYRSELVCGGPSSLSATGGRQALLARALEETRALIWNHQEVAPESLRKLAAHCERDTDLFELCEPLLDIEAIESVVAPMQVLFSYLLSQHGTSVDELAKRIKKEWVTLKHVQPQRLDAALARTISRDEPMTRLWSSLANYSAEGNWTEVVRELATLNAAVMLRRRSVGPWLTISSSGRLDVKQASQRTSLSQLDELDTRGRNRYFIDTMLNLLNALA